MLKDKNSIPWRVAVVPIALNALHIIFRHLKECLSMSRSFALDTPYDIHISIAKPNDGCSGLEIWIWISFNECSPKSTQKKNVKNRKMKKNHLLLHLYTCIVGLVSPLLQSNISFFIFGNFIRMWGSLMKSNRIQPKH